MWPSMWLTATSGSPWLAARPFATLIPTSSEPMSPGPYVTAKASRSGSIGLGLAEGGLEAGTIHRSCWRAATSGTIPPVTACRATWLATTFDSIRRPPNTTATAGLVAARLDGEDARALHRPPSSPPANGPGVVGRRLAGRLHRVTHGALPSGGVVMM